MESIDPNQDIVIFENSPANDASDSVGYEIDNSSIKQGFGGIIAGGDSNSGKVMVDTAGVAFKDKTIIQSDNIVIDGTTQTNGNDLALVTGNTVDINNDITTSGGNLDINSGGEINSSGVIDTGGAITGNPAGAVNINATANITTTDIKTNSAFGSPNAITLSSTAGSIDTTAGSLNSSAQGVGDAAAISLEAAGNINAGDIVTSSLNGNGGDVTLISQNGAASTLGIDAGSVDLRVGDTITFNGNIVTSGGGFSLTGKALLANDTQISTNGGNIDFNGLVNGNFPLTLAAGTTGNIRFSKDVGTEEPLSQVNIESANDVTIDASFVAGATKVFHSGDFTTNPAGSLDLKSLTIKKSEDNSANLKGTVAGKADKETALAVDGPVGDPKFIINGCVIGISCIIPEKPVNIPELPLEAEPRPTSGLSNDIESMSTEIDAAVAEGLQEILVVMQKRRPSNNPVTYQYSNFGNTEMWDDVPGAYSISSFAAFSPVAVEKEEDNSEADEVK